MYSDIERYTADSSVAPALIREYLIMYSDSSVAPALIRCRN